MPILKGLCNFTSASNPPKANKMQILAGISAEAFPCYLILGRGLPTRSPGILCSLSIWTGAARSPGRETRRCLQLSHHKVSSSSVTSQTQILVKIWKSLLVLHSSSTQHQALDAHSLILRELFLQLEVAITLCSQGAAIHCIKHPQLPFCQTVASHTAPSL